MNQSDAKKHFYRGVELQKDGRHDEAIEEYTKAIEIYPNYAFAYRNRGHAYKEQGGKVEAIADYEMFIALSDNPASVGMVQGWIGELSR
jgi:tetratricopeptide (TPR) repeat protein